MGSQEKKYTNYPILFTLTVLAITTFGVLVLRSALEPLREDPEKADSLVGTTASKSLWGMDLDRVGFEPT